MEKLFALTQFILTALASAGAVAGITYHIIAGNIVHPVAYAVVGIIFILLGALCGGAWKEMRETLLNDKL